MIRFLFVYMLIGATIYAHPEHIGSETELIWGIPFILTILSIAIGPLFFERIWHRHYGKIVSLFACMVLLAVYSCKGMYPLTHLLTHCVIQDYLPFIIMIGVLFVVTGGINLRIYYAPRPLTNSSLLAIATLLASVFGTTGAAMIFIKPLIKLNADRKYKAHTIIFFIILVCNIGGCLSAIGDPPLFIGFLYGVPFFWPAYYLLFSFIVLYVPLITLYYIIDNHYFKKEGGEATLASNEYSNKLKLEGTHNIIILIFAILAVIVSSFKFITNFVDDITLSGVIIEGATIIRCGLLIGLAIISRAMTSSQVFRANDFSWEPLKEIAKLFLVIFITAYPVIEILQQGDNCALGFITSKVNSNGIPKEYIYFWSTGILSSFLDNAPTYMIFFNIAGGDVLSLTGSLSKTLTAISAGAVFMGSLTYIGNAPNFLVKAIAEKFGITMPSFFKYTLIASVLLIPLFLLQTWLFYV